MAQDLELVVGDAEGLLLQRKREPVDDQEPDEVARRTDGQVAELECLGRPGAQRQFPREVEQPSATIAQPQPRETGNGDRRRFRQSFLRRYAVTVESYPSDS